MPSQRISLIPKAKQATIFEMGQRQKAHEQRREQFMTDGQISKDMLYGPGRQRKLTEMRPSNAATPPNPPQPPNQPSSQLLTAVHAAMRDLKQAIEEPTKAGSSTAAALHALDQLPLDLSLLISTKVGRAVQAVCKCEDLLAVRPQARALRDKWKRLVQQLPTAADTALPAPTNPTTKAPKPKRRPDTVPSPQPAKKAKSKPAAAAAEEEPEELWFGSVSCTVVGIQYYQGVVAVACTSVGAVTGSVQVSNGESVLLEREPHNKHDKNAIVVLNMDRVQVGHINRCSISYWCSAWAHTGLRYCQCLGLQSNPVLSVPRPKAVSAYARGCSLIQCCQCLGLRLSVTRV